VKIPAVSYALGAAKIIPIYGFLHKNWVASLAGKSEAVLQVQKVSFLGKDTGKGLNA
jgi:hypothetical protein